MKNHLTLRALVVTFLPFASQAQSVREIVVSAEVAFAAQAAQLGTKAAFLTNCSPTGLVAENGKLLNAQEVWGARPDRPNTKLTWYPVLADAGQSGDLGYTTGPWTSYANDKPQGSGEYVRVWRKQMDGTMKVAVNMAIDRIGAAPGRPTTVPQPRQMVAAATPSTAPSNVIIELDTRFAAAEALKPGATYQQYLSSEARLYRPGLSMMQGEAAVANMKNFTGRYFFAPTTGYLAASGDLGYVVGTLRRPADAKNPEETGTYLRIWRREAVAGWRLVVEIFNTPPTATAPPVKAPEGVNAAATPAKGAQ